MLKLLRGRPLGRGATTGQCSAIVRGRPLDRVVEPDEIKADDIDRGRPCVGNALWQAKHNSPGAEGAGAAGSGAVGGGRERGGGGAEVSVREGTGSRCGDTGCRYTPV